ncbi:MAG: cytidylate kinase family protein [Spirochaetaceae bacterium]|nr:cytidylate kinase family protein [Spirochaetaceae bacterium]
MAVITISREFASLGEETAHTLAELTGYEVADKALIESKLKELGLETQKFQRFDERNPGFWASLSQQRDEYLHYLTEVVYALATQNKCIIVGRGANAILRGVVHVVSIRLIGTKSTRVERVRKLQNLDARHAMQIIESSDHERGGFYKYFFGVNWSDPAEYDLTINTDRCDPMHAAASIKAFCEAIVTPEKEAAGVAKAADLLLGAQIVTEISYHKKIPVHFLEAVVEHGVVVLHGVANTHAAVDSAVAAANLVPGVKHVESAIQLVQEFTVIP